MKIALGRLKWSEYEYFTSSPEAFYYACEGYFDELQHIESIHRQACFINYKVMGGKEANPNKIWPLAADVKQKAKDYKVWGDTPEELIRKAMQVHHIKN